MWRTVPNLFILPSVLGLVRVFWHFECSQYIRAVPTDETRPVLAVPAVLSPEILEVQGVSSATNPEIVRVRKYPQYRTKLRALPVSAVHKPEILRVHEVPAVFSRKYFTTRYWGTCAMLQSTCCHKTVVDRAQAIALDGSDTNAGQDYCVAATSARIYAHCWSVEHDCYHALVVPCLHHIHYIACLLYTSPSPRD